MTPKTQGKRTGKKWTLREHWKRASNANRAGWIVALVSALVGLGTLANSLWQNYQTSENFREEHRPQLVAALNQFPHFWVQPSSAGVSFQSASHITNVGKSPAVHVLEAAEILTSDEPTDSSTSWSDLDKKVDTWFNNVGNPLKKTLNKTSGTYILANGLGVPEKTITQGASDLLIAIQTKNITSQPHYPAELIARIEYQDKDGKKYLTDMCYRVVKLVDSGSGQPFAMACSTHNEFH